MIDEIWKDIPGYEGAYQVSDQGNVRSLDRRVRFVSKAGAECTRLMCGRVLRSGDCKGYRIVNLSGYGTIAIHLLVARAFLPDVHEEVNHKNGVKSDNRLDNLEWVSKSANQQHAVSTGLKSQAKRITATCVEDGSSVTFASMSEASLHFTGQRNRHKAIRQCLEGVRRYAHGHTWERADAVV